MNYISKHCKSYLTMLEFVLEMVNNRFSQHTLKYTCLYLLLNY